MTRILCVVLLMLLLPAGVFAAKKPTVNMDWSSFIYFAGDSDKIAENYPLAAFDFGRTEETIKNWLQSAERRGVLPFVIKDASTDDIYAGNNQFGDNGETSYGVMVLVTSDRANSETFSSLNVIRTDLYCTYNFLFCSADNSDGSLRIIYSIPINVVSENPLQTPAQSALTSDKLAPVFQELLRKSLENQLEPKLKRLKFGDNDMKALSLNTYQVETVKMTSNKARALFGEQAGQMQARVAEWYSGWLAAEGLLVYPPLCDGDWKGSAAGGIFSLTVNSPSGKKIISLQKATNLVRLDITGINCRISKENLVEQQLIYKVWLMAACGGRYAREQDFAFYKNVMTNAQQYDESSQYATGLFAASQLSAEDMAKFLKNQN